jgi:hypothetical protein
MGDLSFNNGFMSEMVSLDDQIKKAAEQYKKFLWNNDIQGQLIEAEIPMPTVVEFADGTRVNFREWTKKMGARCAMTHLGVVAAILTMQPKGDQGWQPFFHQFQPKNAPHLALDPNNVTQLYLVGGKYRITERGIMD